MLPVAFSISECSLLYGHLALPCHSPKVAAHRPIGKGINLDAFCASIRV